MEGAVVLASLRHRLGGAVSCLRSLLGVKSAGVGVVRMAVTELDCAQLDLTVPLGQKLGPHSEDDRLLLRVCLRQLTAAL